MGIRCKKNGEVDEEYKFSVCAGIALVNSHFPFSIGYEVAEECCTSAKKVAKCIKKNECIGNWVDFQICRSVSTLNLESDREKDYELADGSSLILRPYFFEKSVGLSGDNLASIRKWHSAQSYENFKEISKLLSRESDDKQTNEKVKKIPRSIAKQIREEYVKGEESLKQYLYFVNSRGHGLPKIQTIDNNSYKEPFVEIGDEQNATNRATWYDAIELMDYYQNYPGQEVPQGKESEKQQTDENN
jgi:hypothetical protein